MLNAITSFPGGRLRLTKSLEILTRDKMEVLYLEPKCIKWTNTMPSHCESAKLDSAYFTSQLTKRSNRVSTRYPSEVELVNGGRFYCQA